MKQFSLRWLRRLWLFSAIVLVLITVLISLIRATFPLLNSYKGDLSAWLSAEYQLDVQLDHLDASWDKYGPALVISDARWLSAPEQGVDVNIEHIRVRLDVIKSIKRQQWVFSRIALSGVELSLDVEKLQQESGVKQDYDLALVKSILLEKIDDFAIQQGHISLYQNSQLLKQIEIEQLSWLNQGERHQGVGLAQVSGADTSRVKFVVNIYETDSDSISDWLGQLYIQGESLDLAPYLTSYVARPNQLQQAEANFEAWLDFSFHEITQAQLLIGPSQLRWQSAQGFKQLLLDHGQLSFRPTAHGWQMDAKDWQFTAQDQDLDANLAPEQATLVARSTSAISFQAYQRDGYIIASADKLDLLPVTPLLNLFTGKQWPKTSPEDAELYFTTGLWQLLYHIDSQNYLAHGSLDFKQLGDAAQEQRINAQGRFLASNQGGRFTLDVNDSRLDLVKQFQAPLAITRFSLPLIWHYQEQGAVFSSDGFILHNEDLTWQGQFKLDWSESNSPYLSWYSEASVKQAEHAERYFPIQAMGQNVYDYLQPTIAAGQVDTAKILWHGQLNQFPYADGEGIFQAWVPLTNTEFHFYPGWPALSKMRVNLLFQNDGLLMESQEASLMKAQSDKITGKIDHFSPDAQLLIDAKIKGRSEDVSEYLIASPLASSVGAALQALSIEGPVTGELALTIPLNGDDAQVKGRVTLDNNTMQVPLSEDGSQAAALQQVKGRFDFDQGNLTNGLIEAKWTGLPVTVRFNGVEQDNAYQVNLNASADWPVASLEKQWPALRGLNGSGSFGWRAQLDYLQHQGGHRFNAKLHSDLTGLALDLPEPFHKNSLREWPLAIELTGDQGQYELTANIDQKLFFKMQPDASAPKEQSWWLHLGKRLPAKSPSQSRAITLAYKELDIGRWFTWWQQQVASLPDKPSAQSSFSAPSLIKVNVNQGLLWGEQLNGISLSADLFPKSWQVQIASDKVKGTVVNDPDTLNINLQRVSLPEITWPNANLEETSQAWSIDKVKTTQISCDACQFGQYNLGKIEGQILKHKDRVELEKLSLLYGHSDIHLSGHWQSKPLQTQLKGKIQTHDVAKLVQAQGQDSPMKETPGVAEFDFIWSDTPNRFATDKLNGQVSLTTNAGYIADVSDKGTRLFSLLSLDSIRRKLNLDFRDVFADGLYFDSIKASAKISNGVLTNEDFELDAAAGRLIGQGQLDLNQWQMDYGMAFYPNVTSSLPVLAAFTITPVTGLYVLLLSKIFEPVVDIITQVNFSLTGDISNPTIEEIGREQGVVELPQEIKESYEQRITDSINQLQPRR